MGLSNGNGGDSVSCDTKPGALGPGAVAVASASVDWCCRPGSNAANVGTFVGAVWPVKLSTTSMNFAVSAYTNMVDGWASVYTRGAGGEGLRSMVATLEKILSSYSVRRRK
jgi:hypothetical protein